MRRRLHVKLLVALLAGSALALVGIHFLHGFQVKRQAGSLLTQADRAEDQKDYRGAIDYLRRYLGFQPTKTDVLARYVRLMAREDVATTSRARLAALLVLESVLRQDPKRDEERRLVIDLALRSRLYKDAQDHLSFLLGLGTASNDKAADQLLARVLKEDPTKAALVNQLADCLGAQGKYPRARTLFEVAVRSAPTEVATYSGLARLLREQPAEVVRRGEKKASLAGLADKWLDDAVAANSRSGRAHLARAQYRRSYPLPGGREANLQAIERDLQLALQLGGEEAEVLLGLAELALDRNDASRARDLLRRGQQKYERDWRMYLAAARLERGAGRPDAALLYLDRGLEKVPGQLELLWESADLHISTGSSKAQAAIDRLKSKGVLQAELNFLSASVLAGKQQWGQALKLLVNAHAQMVGREGAKSEFATGLLERCNLLLAQCSERLGDPYRALLAYQRIIAARPRSLEAGFGRARALAALGRSREAEAQYRQLVALPNGDVAVVEAARLVLRRNLRQDNPDWDEVDSALRQAERLQPRPVDVALLRAEALSAQAEQEADEGKKTALRQEARGVLLVNLLNAMPVWTGLLRPHMVPVTALPQQRPQAALWLGLAALEERAGNVPAALRWLTEAGERFGDLAELRQARLRYWVRRGGPEAQKALAEIERGLDRFADEERRALQGSLALAHTSLGQPEQARRLWQTLAKVRPDDWAVRLVLFTQALEKDDQQTLDTLLAELRGIEEDGVLWRDASVRRLLRKAEGAEGPARKSALSQARKLTAEIAARWPGWIGVTLLEAQIEDLDGQEEKALAKFQAAIDKGGATVPAVWRSIQILNARGRYREAAALRAQLPRQGPVAAGLEQAAALAALQANENDQALARAERAVARDPRDYRGHLLLGHVYWRKEQPGKAHAALLKARDLAEQAPETWVALVSFLVATGRQEQGKAELARAEKKLTDAKGRLALALCCETVGEKDRAAELFAAPALRASPELYIRQAVAAYHLRTGKPDAARPHLEFLVKNAPDREPRTAVWARGMLAVLTALGGDYTKTMASLTPLEEAQPEDSVSRTLVRRYQAAILASRGNRADRQKAIGLLEAIVTDKMDAPTDRLLLAQLYEANGQWPRARQQLAGLLKRSDGNTPPNLVAFIAALLRHDEVDEAATALEPLEKFRGAADTLAVVSLKAQVRHRQGKKEEAVRLLTEHAAKNGQAYGLVATVLENLKEPEAAEKMFKRHAEKSSNPAAPLAYADFLGRQKRFAAALDVCRPAWGKNSAPLVANTCMRILQASGDDKEVQAAVEAQFLAALMKEPSSVLLRLALANLRVVQRRYEDAENVYLTLIAENADNYLARNNFAWLLACQKKQLGEARKLIEEAISRAGPRALLLDTKALVCLAEGKPKDAVSLLEGVVAEAPTSATYHFHLAQARLADGNRVGAKRSLLQAQEAGLKAGGLHPLERPGYESLLRNLGLD